MQRNKPIGYCLFCLLLAAALFLTLWAVNSHTFRLKPDDPALAAEAAWRVVLIDPSAAEMENGIVRYRLTLPDAEHLCLFQPKARSAKLYVNGFPAEQMTQDKQNLFLLSRIQPAPKVYEIEIHHVRNLSDVNACLYLGSFGVIERCKEEQFFSRFFVAGLCAAVFLIALILLLRKPSEKYLLLLALFALLRVFSTFSREVVSAASVWFPLLPDLTDRIGTPELREWFTLILPAFLQFLVLREFAPSRVGRISLFVPIFFSLIPVGIPADLLPSRQLIRFPYLAVTAICYLISLYQMNPDDKKARFHISVLGTALGLFTALAFFLPIAQLNLIPHGTLDLRLHLAPIQTAIYPAAFLLITCDIFAGKFREADILNAHLEEQIEENTRQHTLFIRSMLHNLKTPLFSLSGYSDMAAASVRANPAGCEGYIHKIKDNVIYVGHLLDQLFLLTQMDAGQVSFQNINVCLTDLLHSVQDVSAVAVHKKDIHLMLDVPDDLYVSGDALYLQQALQNMADNAIIHTSPGGTVSIKAAQEQLSCVVTISDNGCGISAEDLPHIFDRYFSNRHGERSSSGLGLTIARMIVEGMGGTIRVDSREGEGTCFTITLPSARMEEDMEP